MSEWYFEMVIEDGEVVYTLSRDHTEGIVRKESIQVTREEYEAWLKRDHQ